MWGDESVNFLKLKVPNLLVFLCSFSFLLITLSICDWNHLPFFFNTFLGLAISKLCTLLQLHFPTSPPRSKCFLDIQFIHFIANNFSKYFSCTWHHSRSFKLTVLTFLQPTVQWLSQSHTFNFFVLYSIPLLVPIYVLVKVTLASVT